MAFNVRLLRLWSVPLLGGLLLSAVLVSAQPATCTAQELLSFARAGAACLLMEPGEACYGAGTVTASALDQLGAIAPLADLTDITLSVPPQGVSVAALIVQPEPRAESGIAIQAMGALRLINEVERPVEVTAIAIGAAILRALPQADGDIVGQLAVNQGVVVNGRADGDWLRVRLPDTGAAAWVNRGSFSISGVEILPVVRPGDPVERPFQRFSIIPAADNFSACGGTVGSVVYVQTSSETAFSPLVVNGAPLAVRGTLRFDVEIDALWLVALDGDAEVGGETAPVYLPAGARMRLPLDADNRVVLADVGPEPYGPDAVSDPLLTNLPARAVPVTALTADEIAAAVERHTTAVTAAAAPLVTPPPDTTCRRMVWRSTSVRSGPGEFYATVYTLDASTPVEVVLSSLDPDGGIWWQIRESGWIDPASVTETGICDDPVYVESVPPPPTNTLIMETCQTQNGPLRAGQQVTIQFMPPAWDSYQAAVQATRTDRGSVRVNSIRYPASASAPIRLGTNDDPFEDRYVRLFSYVWEAEAGTFRIIGDWLHYEPLCTVSIGLPAR